MRASVAGWPTSLPHLAAEADIVLLTDAGRRPAAFSLPGTGLLAEAPLWLPARAPELVWIQVERAPLAPRLPRLFHGTFNQLPAAWRGPSVVTFHDLATRDHPEDFTGTPVKRMIWNAQFRQAAHQAIAIQTDSEYIRQAVLAAYPVDPAMSSWPPRRSTRCSRQAPGGRALASPWASQAATSWPWAEPAAEASQWRWRRGPRPGPTAPPRTSSWSATRPPTRRPGLVQRRTGA